MSPPKVQSIPATKAKTRFGWLIRQVSTQGTSFIIETRGEPKAAVINLSDFQRLWPLEEARPGLERERVRDVLRAAGLLSEPTPRELAEVQAFEEEYPPVEQERILTEWRRLRIEPSLSQIILSNRERHPELAEGRGVR